MKLGNSERHNHTNDHDGSNQAGVAFCCLFEPADAQADEHATGKERFDEESALEMRHQNPESDLAGEHQEHGDRQTAAAGPGEPSERAEGGGGPKHGKTPFDAEARDVSPVGPSVRADAGARAIARVEEPLPTEFSQSLARPANRGVGLGPAFDFDVAPVGLAERFRGEGENGVPGPHGVADEVRSEGEQPRNGERSEDPPPPRKRAGPRHGHFSGHVRTHPHLIQPQHQNQPHRHRDHRPRRELRQRRQPR